MSPEAPEVWVKEALKGDGDAGCSVLCSVCISLGPPEKQNQQNVYIDGWSPAESKISRKTSRLESLRRVAVQV